MRKLPSICYHDYSFYVVIGDFYSDIVYFIRNKELLGETLYIAPTL